MNANNKLVDKVILKVKYKKEYDGYVEIKKDEYKDNRGKIFVCNNEDKKKATVFERYETKTPNKTGYFYKVEGSEDDEGASLWMDEHTVNGVLYANRRSDDDVFGFSDNVHSWIEDSSSKKRLCACLGVAVSSKVNEALALPRSGMGSHDQDKMSKANGGDQIFCNGKKSRKGLEVSVEKV